MNINTFRSNKMNIEYISVKQGEINIFRSNKVNTEYTSVVLWPLEHGNDSTFVYNGPSTPPYAEIRFLNVLSFTFDQ